MPDCKCKRCTSCDKYLKIKYARNISNFTRTRETFKNDNTPINNADGWIALSISKNAVDQYGKYYNLLVKTNVVIVVEGDESEDVSLTTYLVAWKGCNGERRSRNFTFSGSRKEDTQERKGTWYDETTDSKLIIETDNAEYGIIYIPRYPK